MSDAVLERARGGRVVLLTGAGISAESGIPTFRGEDGYWTVGSAVYRPEEMATRAAFERMPYELWAWYLYRRAFCRGAQPNSAHRAAARLHHLGDRFTLITQNVDGLHRRAGSDGESTYEIHGNIDYMRCAEGCRATLLPVPMAFDERPNESPITEAEQQQLRCPTCGGMTRPHVLWFDEVYNELWFRFDSSIAAALACDVLIIVGTSGSTNLPTQVAHLAAQRCASIVEINTERSTFTGLAEGSGGGWLRGTAVEHLPPLVDDLLGS